MAARVPRITYTCPICSKKFQDRPVRKRIYCSRECKHEARKRTRRLVSATCDFCGKEYFAQDGSDWQTHTQQRFCSNICKGKGIAKERGLHVRKKTSFTCENCGKLFIRMARKDRSYLYCSRECFWQHHRGKNHHCWQGGTERYYGPNWDEQRLRALERDNYTCQQCGAQEDGMNVHHIIPRKSFSEDSWDAMNDLSNLTTLCHSCHARFHMIQHY